MHLLLLLSVVQLFAKQEIVETPVTYTDNGTTLKGYLIQPAASKKNASAIMVVHEWWGLNEYPKTRARELAKMGYIAFCIDMFGNGKVVDNPTDAGKLAGVIYSNPTILKSRFQAAFDTLSKMKGVDKNKIAAIGYCFGGNVVLNAAKMGIPLASVVSFHGGLQGPNPDKNTLKAKILICHGGADPFVPETEVNQFKKGLDSIGFAYTFKVYSGATHAFSNPNATEVGLKFNLPIAYNEAADKSSWADMKKFLKKSLK